MKNAMDAGLCSLEAMAVGVTSNCNRNARLPITQILKANRDEKGLWLPRVAMSLEETEFECRPHGKALSEGIASSSLFFMVSRQIVYPFRS
jgi:hypothetical protein